jgi:hypothetical protein
MENRDKRGNLLAFASNFQEGMQLRDYFAAKAMITLIDVFKDDETIKDQVTRIEVVAAASYRLADAMIAARGNK